MQFKATITLNCTTPNHRTDTELNELLRAQFAEAFDKGFLWSVVELDTMTIDRIIRLIETP